MLYFIDESGHDHGEAPYEVLAGVAMAESDLWNLIQAIRSAEVEYFGIHMAKVGLELKGGKLLKRKTFRHAAQGPAIEPDRRRDLARAFLEKGWIEQQQGTPQTRQRDEFTAYGQACLAFVHKVIGLMARYRVKTFAALVNTHAPGSADDSILRRDYAFLFERFFYYLEDRSSHEMGIIVFDELEKAQCRLLINQLEKYFLETTKGYERSARIVPEPFFVHSDLTTAVQLADISAYCLNWVTRLNRMTEPVRDELRPFAEQIFDLRYVGERPDELGARVWPVYGIFYLDDLRPRRERLPVES